MCARHTHCDRCDEVGPYRDGNRTHEFPATVEIADFDHFRTSTAEYALCADCTRELAVFLDDEEMADTLWKTYSDADERASNHCEDGGDGDGG